MNRRLGLIVTGATIGIEITADHVTLDLNGFSIIAGTFGSRGVIASTRNVTIRDGTVRGFALAGIEIGADSRVEGVRAVDISGMSGMFTIGRGIVVGSGGSVLHCTATGCAITGIATGEGSSVLDCVARDNGSYGIQSANSLVRGCSAIGNGTGNIDDPSGVGTLVDNHAP